MTSGEQDAPNGDTTPAELDTAPAELNDPFGAEKDEDHHLPPGEAIYGEHEDFPAEAASEEQPSAGGTQAATVTQAAAKAAPAPPARKLPRIPLVGIGFLLLLVFVLFMYFQNRSKQSLQSSDDLGPGIANGPGLKGHLVTKWEGKAKYQLRVEPIYARQLAGFTRVVASPPQPLSINIRLLDSSGFALCGKEIFFRFDPTKAGVAAAKGGNLESQEAAEVEREHGKDIFQNQTTDEGVIEAVNAQGDLPCSVKDYQRADYWDFTTNFPNLDEQEALLSGQRIVAGPATEADAQGQSRGQGASRRASRRKPFSKPMADFYIQGDDRVTDYDANSGALEAGRSFYIDRKNEQLIAADWAANSSIIHYSCDPHASCTLTHPGSAAVIHAQLSR
jgi:hypothetical protein